MKKADFSITKTPKMAIQTDQLLNEFQSNPQVQRKMKQAGISPERLLKYPWQIKRWYDGLSLCGGCQGLASCKQKTKGYVENLVDDGVLHTVQTPCKYMQDEIKSTAHLRMYLSYKDLPTDFYTVSLTGEPVNKKEYIAAYTAAGIAFSEKRGLYLYGPFGTGKSYIAAAACNDAARTGFRCAYIHYPTFVQRMAAGIPDGEYTIELQRVMRADFLVIDDIGAEGVTAWNRDSILLPILNARYEGKLITWFTSNYAVEQLKDHFIVNRYADDETKAQRITERISRLASTQPLTGEDMRKSLY